MVKGTIMKNMRKIAYLVDDGGFIKNSILCGENTNGNLIQLEHNMFKPRWDFKRGKWEETASKGEKKEILDAEKNRKLLILKSHCEKNILSKAPFHKQINAILFDSAEKDEIKKHIKRCKEKYSKLKKEIFSAKSMKKIECISNAYIENFLNGDK